jgi:hypothetical protein
MVIDRDDVTPNPEEPDQEPIPDPGEPVPEPEPQPHEESVHEEEE